MLGIEPEVVLVPCSGGGLSAGIALALTERFPGVSVYAAEPEGFDDYARSLESGKPERNAKLAGSICDALMAPAPGAVGFEITRRRLAGAVAASDAEALIAVGLAFDELRLVTEPSGAVGLAALLAGRPKVTDKTVIVVLSGGNVGDERLAEAIRAYRSSEGSGIIPS